ncbi:hypothetical protein NC653_007134 [Populus alba x Populus x berolinensis]|uniref:Uncharacterized protein n=1 Tax=Populus alba x Populus x berolinensis TaxID=444605 RepID=A0AAD6RGH9_9ROSI|nr:hypothetical protein NC653_007134 [Populus alba x Populus x berolinensis]
MSNQLQPAQEINRSGKPAESRPYAEHCNRTISLGREPHPNEYLPLRQRAAEGSHQQLQSL